MKNLKHLKAGALCLLLCLAGSVLKAQSTINHDINPGDGVIQAGDIDPEKPDYMPPPLPPFPLDIKEDSKVVVGFYPNPCKDQLTIETSTEREEVQITIYNITGKVELSELVRNEGIIDVSHLRPGVYIINDGHSSSRLLKS